MLQWSLGMNKKRLELQRIKIQRIKEIQRNYENVFVPRSKNVYQKSVSMIKNIFQRIWNECRIQFVKMYCCRCHGTSLM